jgi:hypothetical protein
VREHGGLVAHDEDAPILDRDGARDAVARVDREDVAEIDAVGRGLDRLGTALPRA